MFLCRFRIALASAQQCEMSRIQNEKTLAISARSMQASRSGDRLHSASPTFPQKNTMKMPPFMPPCRIRTIRSRLRTTSVTALNLTTGVALLLLITLAWWNVPLTNSPAQSVRYTLDPVEPDLAWWEVRRFKHHAETRLPLYRRQFEEAAQIHGIPWTLLAAQAYQESRWDRHAVSPTGVRGLMMLTRNTASSLGIQNRTDPDKSIEGGARYLADMERQISVHSRASERLLIALAAYNVGMGHVKDAQQLASQRGENPHSWEAIKAVLPLVSQKKYYQTLRHGYARGWEPVQYVKRIRAYHALLEQHLREI